MALVSAVPRHDAADLFLIRRQWPRHILRPVSSMTQIAVIFCDTSRPTWWVIEQPPMEKPPSYTARNAALSETSMAAAITRCPHIHQREMLPSRA
jgi:hypothetical protein